MEGQYQGMCRRHSDPQEDTELCSAEAFVVAEDQNLGHLEVEVQRKGLELQRQAVAKADATPPCCPVCHQQLSCLTHGHERTFRTSFGPFTPRRTRGWCRQCKKWRFPAEEEVLLCLGTFWRSERRHLLFPHTHALQPV